MINLSFTAPVTGSYHFSVSVYSNCSLSCIIGSANTVENAFAFDPSVGSSFPVALTSGQSVVITFDPSIGFNNWDEVRANDLCVLWEYETDTDTHFDNTLSPVELITNEDPIETDPMELFLLDPDRGEKIQYQPVLTPNLVGLGYSAPSVDPDRQSRNPFIISATFTLSDQDDIAYVKDFYDLHKGRAFSFAVPSWHHDLIVEDYLSIEPSPYPEGYSMLTVLPHEVDIQVGDYLYFRYSGSSPEYQVRKVFAFSTAEATHIYFKGPALGSITEGTGVFLILRCTFRDDALEINMLTDSKGTVNLGFIEELRASGVDQGTIPDEMELEPGPGGDS